MKKGTINEGERNGKKRVVILFVLIGILLVGSGALFASIPYLNTLPMYKTVSSTYSTSFLTNTTALDSDNSLVIKNNNSFGKEETFTLSSSGANILLGNHETKAYLYSVKDGATTNVSMNFTVADTDFKDVRYSVSICRENGSGVNKINSSLIVHSEENPAMATINWTSNIFIKEVTVSYKVRIK